MNHDDELKASIGTFVAESRDLLQEMEATLLGLSHAEVSKEAIHAIFRAAHTIKGSSGLFGLDHIVQFTHVVESVLELVRNDEVELNEDLIGVLLPCCDHLNVLINGVAEGIYEANESLTEAGQLLHQQLWRFLSSDFESDVETQQQSATLTSNTNEHATQSGGGVVESGNWYLSLAFNPECLRSGMDPLSFIRYLSTLGDVINVVTLYGKMPNAEDMDTELCYLEFGVALKSTASKESIESVFEFVRDGSTIRIIPPNSKIDEYIDVIKNLPDDNELLGEILIKSGVLTPHELSECLKIQQSNKNQDNPQANEPLGEILVNQEILQSSVVNAALQKQKQIKESKASERQSIRVDAERLDQLIDLVGELVIAGAGASLRANRTDDIALQEATEEVMRLVEEVRDSSLQLRMVPIGSTFSRFQRVVRDVSKELGKDIVLEISGGETEVDKSVVEKIGDPLMHLVRNSMDHGIEHADVRVARGKPGQGTLRLNAFHESGSIVIEVIDDGGGLNKEKILEKALARGIINANHNLSEKEIYALIFEPGFSTADQVSNLSGRGVGMDVVKKNVTALRGTIDIDSTPGYGVAMRIRLPLTLAIIDGFLVKLAESYFVIPLDHVIECMELPKSSNNIDYMDLRGEILPLVRVRNLFGITGEKPVRQNVVVVACAGSRCGIVVDKLLGEFQTVIKPLGRLFGHVKGIGGSTILGSGEVALIISVASMTQHVKRREHSLKKQWEVSVNG